MTPTFSIIANGKDISGDVSSRLVTMTIVDTVDESSDTLTIVLEDSAGTLALPSSGARLDVSLGYDGANERIGSFIVDEVEIDGPPDRVTITANSTPFVAGRDGAKALTDRKSRSFEGKTLGEIARAVAGEVGLTPIIDQALEAVEVPYIAQTNESSMNLLLRLVRRFGGILKPADGKLVIVDEEGGKSATGKAVGLSLARGDLSRWNVRLGGKAQAITKVKASSYSYQTAATTTEEVTVGKGQFEAPEGATGADVDSFYQSILDSNSSPAEAKAEAKTKAKRIERSKKSVTLTMPGRIDVVAGAALTVSGVRQGVDGQWKLKSVTHTVTRSGWSTTAAGEGK